MNNSFLPEGYKVPSANDGYMKLEQGDNTFRILSQRPIMGEEWWVSLPDGKRSPRRVKAGQNIPVKDVEGDIKHFWAFVVYNRANERVQILEITQKSIMRSLEDLLNNPHWGHPNGYDITINKKGEKLEAKYTVMPLPQSKFELDHIIATAAKVNLEALFDNGDPFDFEEATLSTNNAPEIDPDEVPF